jgi:ATP-dependent Clp protease ATP-binding subunit ClpA
VELILREGFSEESGARHLERAVDRLLGGQLAAALLGGEISDGPTVKLVAEDGRIQFE